MKFNNHSHRDPTYIDSTTELDIEITTSGPIAQTEKPAEDVVTETCKTLIEDNSCQKEQESKTDLPKQSVKDFLHKDVFLEGFIWE